MLFQPSNIAPSTLSGIGIGTVDVTQGLDVSWQVNGDSPMTDYQITIYQNDTASTQMYTTGKITLGTPFQTHDAQGNPQFFSTAISAATLSTAGIVNGYANGYKIIIKQWWSANDSVEQTSAAVFITRTTPTLSIDAIPSPVTTSSQTITATYAQAEGDPISTVEWVFALAGQEDTPIKETGAVSTQLLSFTADGLITGNTYSIMCNVVTSNGVEVSTGFIQFSVSYPSSSISTNYKLAQLRNSSAVYLSWEAFANNILSYPYADSTKTTNGITFTVNGEGDISATGTASNDAYFKIAQGTLSNIGLTSGQKLIITSEYSGAQIEVKETNSSNVVVSTITGADPLQYIVPSTANTLAISIVIPKSTVFSTAQTLQPMLFIENDIVAADDVSVGIEPLQDLHGYSKPWAAGGGVNKFDVDSAEWFPGIGSSGNYYKFGHAFTAAGTYALKTYDTGSGSYVQCMIQRADNTWTNATTIQNNGAFETLQAGDTMYVFWGGYTPSNTDAYRASAITGFNAWKIQVALSSTQPDQYYPYSNVCPITGWTGVTVYATGENILPEVSNASIGSVTMTENDDGSYTMTGSISSSIRVAIFNFWDISLGSSNQNDQIKHLPNGTYYANTGATGIRLQVCASNTAGVDDVQFLLSAKEGTFTVDDTYAYNWVRLRIDANEDPNVTVRPIICLNSEQDKSFEPYTGAAYTTDWTSTAGTVYGGSFAPVTGELSSAMANIAAYNGETIGEPWLSSLDEYSPGATPTAGAQVVYTMNTPLEYSLTTQGIPLLSSNNIWSYAGDVTVSYVNVDGVLTTLTGDIVSFSNSTAKTIPKPVFVPEINGVSIYRYTQGEPILRHVYDATTDITSLLDYYAPSKQTVSYLIVAHATASDLFMQTGTFSPTFWFYSVLLCNQDSNGFFHVRSEYVFKYGVETGGVSNNNAPSLQNNFTRYPTRQPISTLYKTGSLKGYIGTVSSQKVYSDSVSLQNAIYEISTSTLTKFLKTRKGETIMAECSSPIQMQTGDNMVQQPLVATIDWVEVGDASEESIVSIGTDSFWPL